jgi:TolA-binding protein
MIGNAKLAKGDKDGAKAAFDKVVADYPTSALTEKARNRSASIK